MNAYTYGPYEQWKGFNQFDKLSVKAFSCFNKLYEANQAKLTRPVQHLFYRFKYIAETTSISIRISNSWTFAIPALILLRSRLEQLVVCSYIIHEDEDQGLGKFVEHIPVQKYQQFKMASQDRKLAEALDRNFDAEEMRSKALECQKNMNPDFDKGSDNFQRKWTNLNLRSMAHKRDALAGEKPYIKHNLEREYLSFYVVMSSLVHSDGASLSHGFLGEFEREGKIVLMPTPSWVITCMISLSHYDILQCYEILTYLNIDDNDYYSRLMEEWIELKDELIKTGENGN